MFNIKYLQRSCVYIVSNNINDKVYIGISTQPLNVRWGKHLSDMKCRHNKFQKALRKHGAENFTIEPLVQCDNFEDMKTLEKFFIKKYDSKKNGYNSTLGGDGTIGYHHSEATKEKMRLKKVGLYDGENNPNYGKTLSNKTKEKIRKKSLGNKRCLGRVLSEETKEKIRQKALGRKVSKETKRKMTEAHIRRHAERKELELIKI